jgi:Tfx family DNA-binding protein
MTQNQVALRLHTSRENISIIEHRAYENIKVAKATIAVLDGLLDSKDLIVPSGASIFEATSMILKKGDALRVKLKLNADSILAIVRSRYKGRIRGHHLTSALKVGIAKDGSLIIK